ncbi:MAG: hypothetical protein ACRDDO_02265 [Plesiomonas shigelloides]
MMTMDMAFQIVLGLVATLGGIFIRGVKHDITQLQSTVDRVKSDYQRREDAKTNFDLMMVTLRDLKAAIDRIDMKLDSKADKQ